ncbi:MAG: hypothetical protein ABIK09_10515 [Pseudomonadota bacterium]
MKGFCTLSLSLLILAGCSGGGGGAGEDAWTGPGWDTRSGDGVPGVDTKPGDLPPGTWTIEKCQTLPGGVECPDGSDFLDLADSVHLGDVVVATEIFSVSDDLEGFFANDGSAGPWSGIMVVFDRGLVSGLEIGGHVAIDGELMEYYCSTQINASSVTPSGETPAPLEPAVIEAGDVVSAGGGTSEDYESCLVTLQDVQVIAVDSAHNSFTLDGGLVVDDTLYGFDRPAVGCTFIQVTGVIQYTFGAYVLLPRSLADLQGDGSPACGGGAVTDPTSVYDIQNSEISKTCTGEMFVNGGSASLTGVVVTTAAMSISNGKYRGYHVQEQAGGPWSGILVLWETDGSAPSLQKGAIIDVSGDWTEFYCLSELKAKTWTVHEPWTGSFHPDAVDPALLAAGDPAAEAWEGVLIAVEDVTVASVDPYGDLILEGSGLKVDNEFVGSFEVQPGATFSSIFGLVYFTFEEYRLLPRSLDDLLK